MYTFLVCILPGTQHVRQPTLENHLSRCNTITVVGSRKKADVYPCYDGTGMPWTCITQQDGLKVMSSCRLARPLPSTELSGKAARLVCAIIEADAEALREANSAQEGISIDLESPEHYCSPVFWEV